MITRTASSPQAGQILVASNSADTDSHPELSADRLLSLDLLRGIAVGGMILVTNPGTYDAVYRQLLHAQWNGMTATDMIFPAFLFAVGVALTFSLTSRMRRGCSRVSLVRHVLLRSVVIFAIGLALNGFPSYSLQTIRIPGVLQRIALCYLCGALMYLALEGGRDQNKGPRNGWKVAGAIVFILAAYWAVLKWLPVPGFGSGRLDPVGNPGAWIDRALWGTKHMWPYGATPGYDVAYDPEGLLSTFPAIATVLTGILTGEWLRTHYTRSRKVLTMAAMGAALTIAGWLLDPLLPINKKIWTSTFVLISSGVSLLALSGLYLVPNDRRTRWLTTPVLIFGKNALLAFAISGIITTLLDHIHVTTRTGVILTLHHSAYLYGFAAWLPPKLSSLAYAVVIVLLNLALLYPLYRRRIFLRV